MSTKSRSVPAEAVRRALSEGGTRMLLLRHADRGPLPDGEPGNEVSLLPTGVERSLALGRTFGSALSSMHTSPLRRCVETAEALVAGAGGRLPIKPDRHLGDPGVYVADGEVAWKAWQTLGHERVVDTIVEGTQLPGLAEPLAATRRLIAWMAKMTEGKPGVHVFVTHDLLVTAAAAHCLRRHLTVEDWPEFLEWLTLDRQGGQLTASYRDLSALVDWGQ